jgi:PilZ domain
MEEEVLTLRYMVIGLRGLTRGDDPLGVRTERRQKRRLPIRARARLWSALDGVIETETVNASSDGFYCISAEWIAPGSALSATLQIPGCWIDAENEPLVLRATVVVVRTEALPEGNNFGIGCQLVDYRVIKGL